MWAHYADSTRDLSWVRRPSVPKTSSGVTECEMCQWGRNVCVPDQTPACVWQIADSGKISNFATHRLPNARHYAKQRFVAQFFRVARAAIGLALPLSPNGHALCISTTSARAADDHASDRGCSNPEHAGRRQSLSTGDRRTAGSGGALGQPLVSLRSRLLTSSSRHGVTTNGG